MAKFAARPPTPMPIAAGAVMANAIAFNSFKNPFGDLLEVLELSLRLLSTICCPECVHHVDRSCPAWTSIAARPIYIPYLTFN